MHFNCFTSGEIVDQQIQEVSSAIKSKKGCCQRLLKPIVSLFNVQRARRQHRSYLYGASALAAAASSGSHLSPLASSFSARSISLTQFLFTGDGTNLYCRVILLLSQWRTQRSAIRQ
jgi:hypothetical protein